MIYWGIRLFGKDAVEAMILMKHSVARKAVTAQRMNS